MQEFFIFTENFCTYSGDQDQLDQLPSVIKLFSVSMLKYFCQFLLELVLYIRYDDSEINFLSLFELKLYQRLATSRYYRAVSSVQSLC